VSKGDRKASTSRDTCSNDAPYRVDAHQRSHNVVYQTARTDLIDLQSAGLLEKEKQGNAHVFFAPEDLRDRLAALAK
jgi:hypothetical protein